MFSPSKVSQSLLHLHKTSFISCDENFWQSLMTVLEHVDFAGVLLCCNSFIIFLGKILWPLFFGSSFNLFFKTRLIFFFFFFSLVSLRCNSWLPDFSKVIADILTWILSDCNQTLTSNVFCQSFLGRWLGSFKSVVVQPLLHNLNFPSSPFYSKRNIKLPGAK